MLHSSNARRPRQRVFKVAFPAGRVLAFAEAVGRGPVQYAFDATAHPLGRLHLLAPHRLQGAEDRRGIDRRNREIPEGGPSVVADALEPYTGMARVPTGALRFAVPFRRLSEGDRSGPL